MVFVLFFIPSVWDAIFPLTLKVFRPSRDTWKKHPNPSTGSEVCPAEADPIGYEVMYHPLTFDWKNSWMFNRSYYSTDAYQLDSLTRILSTIIMNCNKTGPQRRQAYTIVPSEGRCIYRGGMPQVISLWMSVLIVQVRLRPALWLFHLG